MKGFLKLSLKRAVSRQTHDDWPIIDVAEGSKQRRVEKSMRNCPKTVTSDTQWWRKFKVDEPEEVCKAGGL